MAVAHAHPAHRRGAPIPFHVLDLPVVSFFLLLIQLYCGPCVLDAARLRRDPGGRGRRICRISAVRGRIADGCASPGLHARRTTTPSHGRGRRRRRRRESALFRASPHSAGRNRRPLARPRMVVRACGRVCVVCVCVWSVCASVWRVCCMCVERERERLGERDKERCELQERERERESERAREGEGEREREREREKWDRTGYVNTPARRCQPPSQRTRLPVSPVRRPTRLRTARSPFPNLGKV